MACAFSLLWLARLSRMTTSPGFSVGASWVSTLGLEDRPGHRLVDHPRRGQAIAPQAGDEGLRAPMAERRPGSQPNAEASAPAPTRHLRRGAGLIEEDQAIGLLAQARLAMRLPVGTRLTHVGALGLGGQKRFF